MYNCARIAMDTNGAASEWWLRSPGILSSFAARVGDSGFVIIGGSLVFGSGADSGGVRPALWLNL